MEGFTQDQKKVIGKYVKRFFDDNSTDEDEGEITKKFWNVDG